MYAVFQPDLNLLRLSDYRMEFHFRRRVILLLFIRAHNSSGNFRAKGRLSPPEPVLNPLIRMKSSGED